MSDREEFELPIYKSECHEIQWLIVPDTNGLADLLLVKLELMSLLLGLFLLLHCSGKNLVVVIFIYALSYVF